MALLKGAAVAASTCAALLYLTSAPTATAVERKADVTATASAYVQTTTVAPTAFSLPNGFQFHKETEGLNKELRIRVELLLADADNGGKIKLESAYRTPERQQELVNCHAAHDPACPYPADSPNESEHVKGNAVDFNGDLVLAVKLASRYGLYQRYGQRDPVHFELDPNRKSIEVSK